MLEFIIAMENETGEACFYYFSLNVIGYFWMQNKSQKKILFGSIYGEYGVNTGLLIYWFFYVLEKKM